MKKILSSLGSIGIMGFACSSTVACINRHKDSRIDISKIEDIVIRGGMNLDQIKIIIQTKLDTLIQGGTKLVLDTDYTITMPDDGARASAQITIASSKNSKLIKNTLVITIQAPLETPLLDTLRAKIGAAKTALGSITGVKKAQSDKEALQTAINIAESINSEDGVGDATATLNIAINTFNDATTPLLEALATAIGVAKTTLNNGVKKAQIAKDALQAAIDTAERISSEDTARDGKTALVQAVNVFNGVTTPKYDALQAEITKAQKSLVEHSTATSGAKWIFQTAINVAKKIASEDEVGDAKATLTAAISTFESSVKTQLIAEVRKLITSRLLTSNPIATSVLQQKIQDVEDMQDETEFSTMNAILETAIKDFKKAIITPETSSFVALQNSHDAACDLLYSVEGRKKSPAVKQELGRLIRVCEEATTTTEAESLKTQLDAAIINFREQPAAPNLNALKDLINDAEVHEPQGQSTTKTQVENELINALDHARSINEEIRAEAALTRLRNALNALISSKTN
ncbi:hypothetical protein [Williamsoniiplasma lucivorax]|uniref:Lipoprotein n=1 Tax=Williamsoniiplasma lucivorax TaxID=209274 RepID=A0A2S5R9X1_9MOLU|nr:hypothetical protein [Williamsoniiplasma lucivorax]PPE04129.1 hypothetical protein ELUCI_v1c09090 [Williamsoniiplasma lucivorax]